MADLLSKDHRILEKGFMEYRPFGVDLRGEKIRDVSGLVVKANVEYLEEVISRARGPDAGARAIEELARLLNERIRDPAYHVTHAFLKNPWNSYSYEFVVFLGELCQVLSGDPSFSFRCGQEKFLPPLIQILGRPFSLPQIYKMFAYFGEKYARGSLTFEVETVCHGTAILRMRLTDQVHRQFGPHLKASASLVCQSAKAALSAIPAHVHGMMQGAAIHDRLCLAEGDDCCEWEFTWPHEGSGTLSWSLVGVLAGGLTFAYLYGRHPGKGMAEALVGALVPAVAVWLVGIWQTLYRKRTARRRLLEEQFNHLEARHEELRETCLEQSQTMVELRRKIGQLTSLHHTGLIFSPTRTRNRDTLIEKVLHTIVQDLHYDHAMLAFYDPDRRVSYDARIHGATPNIASWVRSLEVPVNNPQSLEGKVLLQAAPLLVPHLQDVLDQIHPLNRQLANDVHAKSVVAVPLKINNTVIGALTVDRVQAHNMTQEDLDLMVTVANQVAIALENADAYRLIEDLNAGLEAKVRQRTEELAQLNRELVVANEQLQLVDQQKDLFLSQVSHELRTPLTSIKGFVENLLEGVADSSEKQERYLMRIRANADRLNRMINELLDVARIKVGKIELGITDVDLVTLAAEVVDQFRPMAIAKRQQLRFQCHHDDVIVRGDADKLTQILTNLVDNAVKYTPDEGGITVEVVRDDLHFTRVSVIDTGEGIPSHLLPKLFDPFFRISRLTQGGKKGLGLGLWIVKNLIEAQDGTITVTSEVGKGSEFRVTVPLSKVQEMADYQ